MVPVARTRTPTPIPGRIVASLHGERPVVAARPRDPPPAPPFPHPRARTVEPVSDPAPHAATPDPPAEAAAVPVPPSVPIAAPRRSEDPTEEITIEPSVEALAAPRPAVAWVLVGGIGVTGAVFVGVGLAAAVVLGVAVLTSSL